MRSFVSIFLSIYIFYLLNAQEVKRPRIIYAPAKLKDAPVSKPKNKLDKKKVEIKSDETQTTPKPVEVKKPVTSKALPSNAAPSGTIKPVNAPIVPAVTTTEAPKPRIDTIVRLGGKKIGCDVKKVGVNEVIYIKLGQTEQLEMPRKDIEKIIYRNGRVETLNKPIFAMVEETSWEAILVTDKAEDVAGLYKRGLVKANAGSGNPNQKAAKKSATIRLQKKAANIGGQIVFITSSEMKGGYGESPGWDLEGIAFADVPPTDSAAVNKAIDRALNKGKKKKEKKK